VKATPEQQRILARFSGFGDSAFEAAFRGWSYNKSEEPWAQRGQELRSLVTSEEFASLERSRINAFYTSPSVVRAMWKAVERMNAGGLSELRVLEPSAGSGRFLGLQPGSLLRQSRRTAVELDQLT